MNKLKITFKSKDNGEVYIVLRDKVKNKRVRVTKKISMNSARILKEMIAFIFAEEDVYSLDVEKMNILKKIFCANSNIDLLDEEVKYILRILDELITKLIYEEKKSGDISIEEKYMPITNEKYNNKIINILLKGAFGSGKSTIIKKSIGIIDEVDIPLTDKGRTTTYESEYILTHNVNKGFIVLFSKYEDVCCKIEECLHRAQNKYLDMYFQNKNLETEELKMKVIESFYSDPQNVFKIFYTTGKYYSKDNLIKRYKEKYEEKHEELKDQLTFWNNVFESIRENIENIIKEECVVISGKEYELIKQIISDEIKKSDKIDELVDKCMEYIEFKVRGICGELEGDGLGEILYDDNNEVIGFYCRNYDFNNIEKYLRVFTSNNAKYFSKLLTPLVSKIRIEVPFNEETNEIKELEKYTIVMNDTIGTLHQSEKSTESIEGSSKINYENYDFIIAVDNAERPMDTTIINILKELYSNTVNEKIILAYTHYDEFSKKDHEDEYTKMEDLKLIQNGAIAGINEEYNELLMDNTIILKNLIFNKEYEDEKPIKNLFNIIINKYKSLYEFKAIKTNNPEKQLLIYSQSKVGIIYEKVQQKYIEIQKTRYFERYPHYKVTEALTRRLMQGETYYIGAETLKPIDDFVQIFMDQIKEYIFNPLEVNFTPKVTVSDHVKKVEDWLKEKVSTKIKHIAIMVFITWQNNGDIGNWRRAYLYSGFESDWKRRSKIIDVFKEYLPETALNNSKPISDFWLETISNIINNSLEEMKKEAKEELGEI